jgi:hypothetical protein
MGFDLLEVMNCIMRAFLYVTLLTLFYLHCQSAHASIPEPALSLPTLPQQYIAARFQAIQQSFEQRAVLFLKGKPFHRWRANKARKEILEEFEQLNDWRLHSWYVDPTANILVSRIDFMVAQDLLEKGLYRKPAFIAFQYNQTDSSYNSSTIVLNSLKCLALESPSARSTRNFLTLLQNHRVTQLVHLSSANENIHQKNEAWVGKLKTNSKHETYLTFPQGNGAAPYRIRYYATDAWEDQQGLNPATLLRLIQSVRNHYDPQGLIACYSTNGGGRTGTFLAGFLLLREIDRQIAAGVGKNLLNISIEKVVMQLSLQRPYLVRTGEQYYTLYRLVDLYIKDLL